MHEDAGRGSGRRGRAGDAALRGLCRSVGLAIVGGLAAIAPSGCDRSRSGGTESAPGRRPNVLWIVWDTVRADHLSLYGYARQTTPHLDAWAKDARVYDDCISAGSTTLPSHASMFTGLLVSEHGGHNGHEALDPGFVTIAELLQGAGYRTFLWSANPQISRAKGFHQGFGVEEHPWNEMYHADALRIVRSKVPPEDHSSELAQAIGTEAESPLHIKACGELAQRGVENWLKASGKDQPFFIFLNYMEAHRPLTPARRFREMVMTPEQVERSYQVDFSKLKMWAYNFRRQSYDASELEILRGTYDAALLELDDLFDKLLSALRAGGHLDDTIIVLMADHGEHLGERHLLGHQYSLYHELTRVPLVVYYPPKLAAGRESRPVMNIDLFPTLLELTNTAPSPGNRSSAVSLLTPRRERIRLSEYPVADFYVIDALKAVYPDLDATPWNRALAAFHDGAWKLIAGSDSRNELYDLEHDPHEAKDLFTDERARGEGLLGHLHEYLAALTRGASVAEVPALSDEDRRRLESLGYLSSPDEPPSSGRRPATQPGPR